MLQEPDMHMSALLRQSICRHSGEEPAQMHCQEGAGIHGGH